MGPVQAMWPRGLERGWLAALFLVVATALASHAQGGVLPRVRPQAQPSSGTAVDAARVPTNILELQVALAWRGFRSGSIDGVPGPQTRAAILAFQRDEGLPATGMAGPDVLGRLPLDEPPLREHVVTASDLLALGVVPSTWAGKAAVDRLPHETLLEALSEQSAAHPALLRRLNPGLAWEAVVAGDRVTVPRFRDPPPRRAAKVRIDGPGRTLQALDERGRILLHAPCSLGRVPASRPRGTFHVARIVGHPTYDFDPARFPESGEARLLGRRLVLPPGPNNPVGIVWIGLDLPGHGIHGTPWPEKVGRTESHGCFRLANWDAASLARLAWPGLEVEVGGAE